MLEKCITSMVLEARMIHFFLPQLAAPYRPARDQPASAQFPPFGEKMRVPRNSDLRFVPFRHPRRGWAPPGGETVAGVEV